ncbi:MAG TPA: hypothetical protein VLC74_08505 [Rhizomicrobium sp.]|nr:hypothetical protein [Rhizomicrobium sp.]
MITKHPWFGPKQFGWGWTPVSWEGWLVTAFFVAVTVAASVVFGRSAMTFYVMIAVVGGLIAVCWLTGTPPG